MASKELLSFGINLLDSDISFVGFIVHFFVQNYSWQRRYLINVAMCLNETINEVRRNLPISDYGI